MTQVATSPLTPTIVAAPEAPTMILGKYKDLPAFENGLRNAMTAALGPTAVKPDAKLIGDGGAYGSQDEAEKAYRMYTQVIKARGVAPSTPATQPEADTKASTPAPSAPETSPITIGGDPAIGDDEPKDVVGIVAKAGLKMDDLVAEFEKSGDLSDEQYKALQGVRKNLGRDDLRLIAEGWAAKQAAGKAAQMAIRAELASVAGSAAQMNQILVDIKGKLTPAEEAAYNKMLADPVTAKPAFQALMQIRKERMGAGGSSDPITPKSSSAAGSIAPLTDRAAINAATNDPRYAPSIRGMPNPKHDPGYRQQVLEAIAAGRGQTP